MLKKIKNISYLLLFFIFIILTVRFYFSDQNVRSVNKFRALYSNEFNNNTKNLPILKSNTNDIIEYIDDVDFNKKNKKDFTFWNLIEK